jgi:hypothetical protein
MDEFFAVKRLFQTGPDCDVLDGGHTVMDIDTENS